MKSLKVTNLDNWRLSKIEEEDQDKMTSSVSSSSSSTSHSSPLKLSGSQQNSKHSSSPLAINKTCTTQSMLQSSNQLNNDSNDDNDDNGYEKVPQSKEEWDKLKFEAAKAEAIKNIKSKYDSLERARMSKQIMQTSVPTNSSSVQNTINSNSAQQSINPSAIESLNSSVHTLNQCLLSSLQQPFNANLSKINYSDPLMDSLSNQMLTVNWSDLPFPPPPDISSSDIFQQNDSFQQQNQIVQPRNIIKSPEINPKLALTKINPTASNYHLSEHDLLQVETFYKGLKTEVYVSNCLAAIYESSPGSEFNTPKLQQKHLQEAKGSPRITRLSSESPTDTRQNTKSCEWKFRKEGIPVFVLDSSQKLLNIILAEKGTAFSLWSDVLTHLSQYRVSNEPDFHVLNSSKDHTKRYGIHFYDVISANTFYDHYVRITNDGENDLLDLSNNRKKKKSKTEGKQSPKNTKINFKKADISQPCCFTHITKIEGADMSSRQQN